MNEEGCKVPLLTAIGN